MNFRAGDVANENRAQTRGPRGPHLVRGVETRRKPMALVAPRSRPTTKYGPSCAATRAPNAQQTFTNQQFTMTAEHPALAGLQCTRNSVTDDDSIRRMASNSPFFWL
jgi:hypothetical protein